MRRPSRTAPTIVVKLSSKSTMWAASRATSVPPDPWRRRCPRGCSAGASFTPSPVIATNWPRSWSAFTILIFCSGATRA